VGGECPYWGCVPSKMMIRAADALAEARRVGELAGMAVVMPDWAPVAQRIRAEATDNWDDRVAVERFEDKGGRLVRGRGRLEGPRRVSVDGTLFEARRGVVIATGTRPWVPPIPGLDTVDYWTNRELIETKELPSSLLVLGGGAVGLELAQAFARFGVDVTVVEALDRLLPSEEPDVGSLLARVLTDEGIQVRTGVSARAVVRDQDLIMVELDDGSQAAGERLLVATGRRADLPSLGVATVGLDELAHVIPVDPHLRAAEGLWAIGDVTGVGEFTHVAVYQSAIAAADILGRPGSGADYRALPRVTFTDPEVGSVGLTERAALRARWRIRVGLAQVPSSARGWIHGAGNARLIKLVEDADHGVLIGATSVGPNGGEVLGLLTLAVHAEVPIGELQHMIYAYPTFDRAVEDALHALVKS
jgi:pyruvate/2-oxoglutarate dehydrogenase complex dihydrolipoamide dehydrogenase (E3) component